MTVTRDVTRSAAPPFGARGRRLWSELNDGTRGPAEVVLIEEACRLADRLDRLDRLLRGDASEWMTLRPQDEDGSTLVLVVDAALSQARMHATTLRGLVAELRQSGGTGASKPTRQGDSIVDQLAAARARRIAGAPGS